MILRIVGISVLCFFNIFLFGLELPQYPSYGPKNVYYLSSEGDYLFGNINYSRLQDDWHLPYIALRDAYEAKGYTFIPFSHGNFMNMFNNKNHDFLQNFVDNTYAIFVEGFAGYITNPLYEKLVRLLDKRFIIMFLESHHLDPAQSDKSIIQYFQKILTWKTEWIDDKKFFEFYFVQSKLKLINDVIPYKDKKLCALIGAYQVVNHPNELYSKRVEAAIFFNAKAPHQFGLYGRGWNANRYISYKGIPSNKTEILKQYKFSICYEGFCDQNGFITEKIFGSLIAGCVPIYWGAPDIELYVPKGCFIDRRNFHDLNDLYAYISNISEEEYSTYLENIKNYFASPQCYKFSIDFFVKNLIRVQLS